jgi:hypothetical protein
MKFAERKHFEDSKILVTLKSTSGYVIGTVSVDTTVSRVGF